MSRNPIDQENAHHAAASEQHKHQPPSPAAKHHKPGHSSKLPLSPLHYHPNLPHSTTNKHTSPVRPRPQLRRRRAAPAADPTQHSRMSSMDRATEVLSQLHFDYSRAKPTEARQRTDRQAASTTASPLLSLEQRYEQWKRFWQSIDSTSGDEQRTRESGHDNSTPAADDDTERLLRWLAFSRQQIHDSTPTDHTQSGSDTSPPSASTDTSATRPISPHSPTYYVNLARFLSTAPPQRHRPRPPLNSHTTHTKPTKPQQRPVEEQSSERAQQEEKEHERSAEETRPARGVESTTERVEIVIDCNDDQHVAHRYIHKPITTTLHPQDKPQPAAFQPPTTLDSASAPSAVPHASSVPPSRPSSAYSFTNLPREHIRPAAPSTAKTAAASFSLHSYFARMSVPQLQRYLQVFNPSLLSSSLALTKDQLISICCTFYRTRIASHRQQPTEQASEQSRQEAAKEAIVAHTQRTYAHLALPALLHTIVASTTLAIAPAALSGVGYVDERSVRSGYRRCMLKVHPDKHTKSGWEEQTRCVELFRLVQDKYAHWQRVHEQR